MSFIKQNNLKYVKNLLHEDELYFFETLFHSKSIILSDKTTYYYNVGNVNSIINNRSEKNTNDYLWSLNYIYENYYLNNAYVEFKNEIAHYIIQLKLNVFHCYQHTKKELQINVAPNIKKCYLKVQPQYTRQLLSKKKHKFIYRFYIVSFLEADTVAKYLNFFNKRGKIVSIQKKALVYYSYLLNYKTIKKNFNIKNN